MNNSNINGRTHFDYIKDATIRHTDNNPEDPQVIEANPIVRTDQRYNIIAAIKDTIAKLRTYGIATLLLLFPLIKGGPDALFAAEGVVSPASVSADTGLWLTGFATGSANLAEASVQALGQIDSLMATSAEVTFLGAADSLEWRGYNHQVGGALDGGKRIERALALRKRYGRGEVGVTHENIRGVKVIVRVSPPFSLTTPASESRSPDYNNDSVPLPKGGPAALFAAEGDSDRYAGWFIWQGAPDPPKRPRAHFLYFGIERVIPGDMPALAGVDGVKWKGSTWSGEVTANIQIGDTPLFLGAGFKYRKDHIDIFQWGIEEVRYAILFPITYHAGARAYLSIIPQAVFHSLETDGTTHAAVRPAVAIRPSLRLPGNIILSAAFEVMWVQLIATPGLVIEYPDTNIGVGLGWMLK